MHAMEGLEELRAGAVCAEGASSCDGKTSSKAGEWSMVWEGKLILHVDEPEMKTGWLMLAEEGALNIT